ncbi:MAG: hypothetical protein M3Y87_17810 [Myxococcota bacterium]|nr:hypothetical protein [Myxococcota bacterium]
MDRSTFTGSLPANDGTLLTPKHDPNGPMLATYRSVLTPEMSSSLEAFIASGRYEGLVRMKGLFSVLAGR